MTETLTSRSSQVHARLEHPVIDGDGHTAEYFPALVPFLEAEGVDLTSPSLRRLLPASFGPDADWAALSTAERAARRVARPPWWGSPARNTRDLATSMFPRLMYERLDEMGLDFAVIYPSVGLAFLHLPDEGERRAACRALNRYNAEAFGPFADRMAPVAAIPMHTPAEAVEEIEWAVDLGYRSVLLAGYVQRPVAALGDTAAGEYARWLDFYGIDSEYDYDPVWEACRRLRLPVAFHSGSIGWGSRMSVSNYMYNHIGHLAEGQHALAKSLFMGGVTRRFPEVRFAFLEGGVAWAASLYADLLGHWEKRNVVALGHLDPAGIDRALFADLLERYGPSSAPEARRVVTRAPVVESERDEWAPCGIERPEDIRDRFVESFFFGCEADDPLTTTAFNTRVNPFGSRLKAMFGSDISHWDVPDMSEVLDEAWEMVDHGLFTPADFRDFVFVNPVRFLAGANPAYFDGTVVETSVRRFLAES
ncbi:MAG: amidohydrolase family protein [Acidimicrobiales bacterium]|jgi:predicted TIM-barrel fold metal-dependent hydrolase